MSENRKIMDALLVELGSVIGKDLRLNEKGCSAFVYDHLTFLIEVPKNSSSFFLSTALMPLIQCNDLKKVLRLNYMQQETRGGCIALDPENDDIIFSYSDRVREVNSAQLRNILENFIDTALTLSTKIQQPTQSAVVKRIY